MKKQVYSVLFLNEFKFVINFVMKNGNKTKISGFLSKILLNIFCLFNWTQWKKKSLTSILDILLNLINKPIKISKIRRGSRYFESIKYVRPGYGLSKALIQLIRNVRLEDINKFEKVFLSIFLRKNVLCTDTLLNRKKSLKKFNLY